MSRSKQSQDDLGNTKTRSQDSAAKQWSFTLAIEHKGQVITWEEVYRKLDPICEDFVFQLETGEKTGYRHFQGSLNLKQKRRFDPVIRLMYPWIHLEKTRYEIEAQGYCKKADTHEVGPWGKGKYFMEQREVLIEKLYDWEEKLIEIFRSKAPHRKIGWVVDEKGGKGKSTFTRYCYRELMKVAVTRCRKAADIVTMAEEDIRIYLIDIPRDVVLDDYSGLEQLKDGFVTDAKLKKKQKVVDMYEIPHVWVFANYKPDIWRLSQDRWEIIGL